jgi:hypothetical protein
MSNGVVCMNLTADAVTKKAPGRPDRDTRGGFHDGWADIQVRDPNAEPVAEWSNHSDLASIEPGPIEPLWSAPEFRPGRYGKGPSTGGRC